MEGQSEFFSTGPLVLEVEVGEEYGVKGDGPSE